MFAKGFRKTAYDTGHMANRPPIMPNKAQAEGIRKGMEQGTGKSMWDNIKSALTPGKTDQFGFPVANN